MRLRSPHPQAERSAATADRWIFLALLVLIAWLPWPWGSHSPWARALLGSLCTGLVVVRLLLAGLSGRELPYLSWHARVALALALAWLAWIALQLVPLPGALLALLSPRSAEIHAALAGIPGAEPMYTISLLPGATLDQWLLSASLVCLYWLVLVTVSQNRGRQRLMLQTILLTGLAQALYGIVMTLSGWEFGFLARKAYNIGYATGTFVNKNHLAAYLGLALSAGLALVLADLRAKPWQGWRDALDGLTELALSPRLRVRVMLAVIVIALVLTRSRMGNGAVFFALALCGSAYMLLRHRRYFRYGLILFASIFLIDLFIVSDWYGLDRLAERIQQTEIEHEDRAALLGDMAPLARQYVVTGSGLGTFGVAFSPIRPDSVKSWYDHAHNDHLEFLIETGVVGYALLVALGALLAFHCGSLIHRRHDPVPAALGFAGAMGLTCVTALGLTDFALRIPAIAATFVALAALALSCSPVPTDARPRTVPTNGATPTA